MSFVGPLTCKKGTGGTSTDQACDDVKFKSCRIEVTSSKYITRTTSLKIASSSMCHLICSSPYRAIWAVIGLIPP